MNNKVIIYVSDFEYSAPYYIVGNARYHENWYEVYYIDTAAEEETA